MIQDTRVKVHVHRRAHCSAASHSGLVYGRHKLALSVSRYGATSIKATTDLTRGQSLAAILY